MNEETKQLPDVIVEAIVKAMGITVDELPLHGTVIFTCNSDGAQTIQVHGLDEPEIWTKPPGMETFTKLQFPYPPKT